VVDQKNCRVVAFDLETEKYAGEIALFGEDVKTHVKYFRPNQFDLSVNVKLETEVSKLVHRLGLDFWPFGLCTRGERVYVTDWHRGMMYVYKKGELEWRLTAPLVNNDKMRKNMSRPRDVLLDSLDSLLITDLDRNSFCFFDHKGAFLFETQVPAGGLRRGGSAVENESGIVGVCKIESNRLIYASNTAVYVLHLNAPT
jgi:hypothetical protein